MTAGWLQTEEWAYPAACPLPDAPEHPAWSDIYRAIEDGPLDDAMADFRYWCEQSFWFFNRYCLSFGELVCGEPDNLHHGRLWIEHPWVYARCMDIQRDPDGQFHRWPRGYFKTSLITQNFTMWEWIRNVEYGVPGVALRTLILTYKAEVTGAAFMFGFKRELQNPRLIMHWPEAFFEDPKQSGDYGQKTLRIRQRGNPREPTLMVSGLDTMPTSQHFDRIILDDPVVRETVRTPDQIASTYEAIKQSTFLRADDTRMRYVGTHWSIGDPWQLGLKEGRFRLDAQDCYDLDGQPVLRSRQYLEEFHRDAGPYEFSAQMRGDPVAADQRRFSETWLKYYDTTPSQERNGKNVYLFIDTARSQKKSSDYTVIWVVGLGADTYLYALDVHRERLSLPEFDELLFDLVAIWRPLIVFQEVFGAARDIEHILDKQRQLNFRFQIEAVPDEKVQKEERIESLMMPFSQGRWWFPKAFGHTPRGEFRDVMRVFREDEYLVWTPSGKTIHDDMLDCLAQTARPRVIDKIRWPQRLPTSRYVTKPERDYYYDDGEGGFSEGRSAPTAWSH